MDADQWNVVCAVVDQPGSDEHCYIGERQQLCAELAERPHRVAVGGPDQWPGNGHWEQLGHLAGLDWDELGHGAD